MNITNSNSDLLHQEVLISTDSNSQLWNICVWDYDSGSSLLNYSNCNTVSHSLSFIKQDFMVTAVYNKPFIYCWNLKSRAQQFTKITCAGCVSALDVSSCGNYIAVGIDDKVNVWQTYSGKILSVLARHFQKITCVKFAYNDQYLITASNDSIILVWDLNEILTKQYDSVEPTFTWNAHSLGINDIFVSKNNHRVLSVSNDQTCKLWNLLSGNLMFSLVFNSIPTRVLLDNIESNLYISLSNGTILNIGIKSVLQESNKIINENEHGTFIGHKQRVNALAISLDDCTLASGSDDCAIRVWDTNTRQCIRVLNHNGPVTNLDFKLGSYFFNDEKSQITPIHTRFYSDTDFNTEDTINALMKPSISLDGKLGIKEFLTDVDLYENADEYFELKNKFESVKQINEKSYKFALNEILRK